jgi:hypothetical protein
MDAQRRFMLYMLLYMQVLIVMAGPWGAVFLGVVGLAELTVWQLQGRPE